MKRIYTAFVTIFWLTMMGFLFQREVLPSLIITSPSGYKITLTKDYPMRESWMSIYFKDKRIGFSNTVIRQDVDKGIPGYRINETTLLRFNMQGHNMLISIKGGAFFSEDHRLKNFDYKLVTGDYKFYVSGNAKGNNLNIIVDAGRDRIEKEIRVNPNILISNSVSPVLLFKHLDIEKKLRFDIFNPITFGVSRVEIRSIGTEELEFNGNLEKVQVFETDFSGIKTKTWIKENGDILKEQSMLGFTMLKDDPASAMDIMHSFSFSAQDLVSEFSLVSDIQISDPRELTFLKIDKNGSPVEVFKGSEPAKEVILSIPIEKDIQEEDFIQSGHEDIIGLAREIVGKEENGWLASKKILHWVYENIEKTPTFSVPSSLDVLRTRRGDCNEHTVLFTALTRSLGIPTKMIAGLVYLEDAFYYHAWPEVYVGEWISVDPTLGQDIADATHIPLLEGGLREQIDLIKIIGSLKIKILEYR